MHNDSLRKILSGVSLCMVFCLVAILAGCKPKAEDAGEAVVAVQAEHPQIAPLSEEIAADAVLAPLAQAAIAPRISAPIRSELVQRGSRVHKGQLLLTLEDRDLQGTALDSKGAYTSAQAAFTATANASLPEDVQKAQLDVEQAGVNLEVAKRTAEERKRLLQEGAIAGRDADTAVAAAVQAQAAYDTAVKRLEHLQQTTQHTTLDAARGQLDSAKGRLENAEAQASYASVHSPIDGVVTDRPLFPGETAAAGTPVITVMDTSSLLAKLHLAQRLTQHFKVGGEAEIQVPGIQELQQASIALISPALDPGSTTVEVWLKLANPNGRFRVGTPVHVVIHGSTIEHALQLPAGAILPGEASTNVLVIGSDGTAHKKPVQVGLRTTEKVQILSGITPSDLVITEGGYGLDEGTKVKLGSKEDEGDKDAAAPAGGKSE